MNLPGCRYPFGDSLSARRPPLGQQTSSSAVEELGVRIYMRPNAIRGKIEKETYEEYGLSDDNKQ